MDIFRRNYGIKTKSVVIGFNQFVFGSKQAAALALENKGFIRFQSVSGKSIFVTVQTQKTAIRFGMEEVEEAPQEEGTEGVEVEVGEDGQARLVVDEDGVVQE